MSENEFLTECESRLSKIDDDLKKVEHKRKALVNERDAYHRILSGERSRLGITTTTGSRPVLGNANPSGSQMNQAQFIRDEIATGRGVTPRELRDLYRKRSGEIPNKSFPLQ